VRDEAEKKSLPTAGQSVHGVAGEHVDFRSSRATRREGGSLEGRTVKRGRQKKQGGLHSLKVMKKGLENFRAIPPRKGKQRKRAVRPSYNIRLPDRERDGKGRDAKRQNRMTGINRAKEAELAVQGRFTGLPDEGKSRLSNGNIWSNLEKGGTNEAP